MSSANLGCAKHSAMCGRRVSRAAACPHVCSSAELLVMSLKDRLVLLGGLAGHCWVKRRSALAKPPFGPKTNSCHSPLCKVTSVGAARAWLKTDTHHPCTPPLPRALLAFRAPSGLASLQHRVWGVSCCEAGWGRPAFGSPLEGFVTPGTPIIDGKLNKTRAEMSRQPKKKSVEHPLVWVDQQLLYTLKSGKVPAHVSSQGQDVVALRRG